MLRIVHSKSTEQAKKYFRVGLSREGNYYCESQEMPGRWFGRGAELLGLKGDVDQPNWELLCDNINPATRKRLTAKTLRNRRVGYDFNFDVPKSVSLAFEWHQDKRIFEVFVRSVRETMAEVEERMATRVRKNGLDEDRMTGNLVGGEYFHFTARPVNGEPDPHLHAHCFVFNATLDEMEKQWKAGQFGEIKGDGYDYQREFMSRLAKGLTELGYEIVKTKNGFELAGVSRSLIEKFSRRMKVVEDMARKLGLTTGKQKDGLAALTRENKEKGLTKSQLHSTIWWPRLIPDEIADLNGLGRSLTRDGKAIEVSKLEAKIPSPTKALLGRAPVSEVAQAAAKLLSGEKRESEPTESKLGRPLIPMKDLRSILEEKPPQKKPVEASQWDRKAVHYAIDHLFERASGVRDRDLAGEALEWGYGLSTVEGVRQAIKDLPLLRGEVKGQTYVTTWKVRAEEGRIVDRSKQGKGKFKAFNPAWKIEKEWFKEKQRDAVSHVLTSEDRIVAIKGKAGTGKTTVMKEITNGMVAAGWKVRAFAPTGKASRKNLREAGFVGAETVEKLLVNPSLQAESKGAVWLIDEAGMLSTRTMDRLTRLAEELDSRIVFIGDPEQHHSVDRGDAFRLLEKYGGMLVFTLDEIQRQKGSYKLAVDLIARKQYDRAIDVLIDIKFVSERPFDEIPGALAKKYISLIDRNKNVIVVAATHAECERITHAIRQEIKESGGLKNGVQRAILRNLTWTEAEKGDERSYQTGQIIEITTKIKGFAIGEQLEVIERIGDGVSARSKEGIKFLPLYDPKAFNVYEQDFIEVCQGDKIEVTSGAKMKDGHRLETRDTHEVVKITSKGEIQLDNGALVDKDFKHIHYGWVSTSFGAQSATVDWVLVSQPSMSFSPARNSEQVYVSVSRGAEGVHIFETEFDGLREDAARASFRPLAMEILEEMETTRLRAVQAVEVLRESRMREREQIPQKTFQRLGQQELVISSEIKESDREAVEQTRKINPVQKTSPNLAKHQARPKAQQTELEVQSKEPAAKIEAAPEKTEMKLEAHIEPIQPVHAKDEPLAPKPLDQVLLAENLGQEPDINVEALQEFLSELHEQVIEYERKPTRQKVIAPPVSEKAVEIEPEQMQIEM